MQAKHFFSVPFHTDFLLPETYKKVAITAPEKWGKGWWMFIYPQEAEDRFSAEAVGKSFLARS